ncbi:unnamed protein product [Moneuplotes crassus]|uniref:Uncharacterized protein n=1 Tax=Euplotes crassus TaxID=5936 RepID=A0AAD1X5N3_EUPCR|nr:unnamed protein product [Moneuplotes crassus]
MSDFGEIKFQPRKTKNYRDSKAICNNFDKIYDTSHKYYKFFTPSSTKMTSRKSRQSSMYSNRTDNKLRKRKDYCKFFTRKDNPNRRAKPAFTNMKCVKPSKELGIKRRREERFNHKTIYNNIRKDDKFKAPNTPSVNKCSLRRGRMIPYNYQCSQSFRESRKRSVSSNNSLFQNETNLSMDHSNFGRCMRRTLRAGKDNKREIPKVILLPQEISHAVESPKKTLTSSSQARSQFVFKMKEVVSSLASSEKYSSNQHTNRAKSPTARVDSGSKNKISEFCGNKKIFGTTNEPLCASGKKYFKTQDKQEKLDKQEKPDEQDMESSACISFPPASNYTKKNEIEERIISSKISNEFSELPMDEHSPDDFRRSISLHQPRQKKFMNKISMPNKMPKPQESSEPKGPKYRMGMILIKTIQKYKMSEKKLISFFDKLIRKVEFHNLIPILNSYLPQDDSACRKNNFNSGCRKTKSPTLMTPIHMLIIQSKYHTLRYLIDKNKQFLAPQSPLSLRGAKMAFKCIISTSKAEPLNLSLSEPSLYNQTLEESINFLKGIDFNIPFSSAKTPTLHLIYKHFQISIAEDLCLRMGLNPFDRDNGKTIDMLPIYTMYEFQKEEKKVWKKCQKMYLRKRFGKKEVKVGKEFI